MKALVSALCLVAMVFSAAARHAAPGALSLFGAEPDLGLAAAFALAANSRPWAGAAAGWFHGALAGWLAGSAFVAHTWAGCVVGLLTALPKRARMETSGPVSGGVVALASLVHGIALVLLAPAPDLGAQVRATILAAVYNGVLAVPIGALLRWAEGPQAD
jgi:hypothetical protein